MEQSSLYSAVRPLGIILSYSPAALGQPPPYPVKSNPQVHALFLKEAGNMLVYPDESWAVETLRQLNLSCCNEGGMG